MRSWTVTVITSLDSDEVAYSCVHPPPNITNPALGQLPPQITSAACETTQNECALPLSPMPLPEGDKADTSQSPERPSRDPQRQGICVSLIMTQFQRRSCLSCHRHAGLLISSSSPSLLALLCFSEILIKRKDSHDECEVTPWQQKEMSGVSEPPSNLKGLTFSTEI